MSKQSAKLCEMRETEFVKKTVTGIREIETDRQDVKRGSEKLSSMLSREKKQSVKAEIQNWKPFSPYLNWYFYYSKIFILDKKKMKSCDEKSDS